MPYSDTHKIIFIHIPKCAGTYIEKHLGMFRNRASLFGSDSNGDFLQHMTMSEFSILKNPSDYFSFAFVRNPYTKLVSDFFWCKGWFKHKWAIPSETGKGFRSFEQFINFIEKHINYCNDNNKRIWSHWRPMTHFVFNNGSKVVDFIGKHENFTEDYTVICQMNNIKIPDNLNKKSTADTYMELYTPELKNKVYNLYKDDFEQFDYS